ncbi:MAG TPA: RIP metalloprotease RseP [Steroidobacteraceae bacterium]|jgi:regulator of sigma E protease|nr:RIP metalloprotease RseP [Steroidobacteraceae bacterium]
MNLVWYALWYVIAVGFLVIVHEYGHFWVARRLGFKVVRFSIGFGKPIWRRVLGKDDTELVIAPIPMGGYVKLLDEREGPVAPQFLARSFTRKPPWQRILVLLAGPGFNLLFAILVLWGMRWVEGINDAKPIIGEVQPASVAARGGLARGDEILTIGDKAVPDSHDVMFDLLDTILGQGEARLTVRSATGHTHSVVLSVPDPAARRQLTEPDMLLAGLGFYFWEPQVPAVLAEVARGGNAERAGLRAGDRIVAINAKPIADFQDVVQVISAAAGSTVTIEYQRAGATHTAQVPVVATPDGAGHMVGRIGIARTSIVKLPPNMMVHTDLSAGAALVSACSDAWNLTATQSKLLWRMLLGQVSVKNLSGPLSIAQFAGESATAGPESFLGFLVLISLAIALFNLLPIPLLDGGQIVFQAAEWIKGKPLSERTQIFGQQVGIALLVLLLGVALFNDVSRQFG